MGRLPVLQGYGRGWGLFLLPVRRYISGMIDDIYNRRILGFAADIPLVRRLPAPDGTAVGHSRLCGSKVTVDVTLDDQGRVSDFGQEVKACALGQASSSIMARHVIGSDVDELRKLRQRMYAMLKENGPPPEGKWADCEALLPVRDFRARHASTLLTFDATLEAVETALARRSGVKAAAPLEQAE